jgi:hypothetical protein
MNNRNGALILIINYYSGLSIVLGVVLAILLNPTGAQLIVFTLCWIYLLPALICRALILMLGRPVGTVDHSSSVFLYWWFLTQLQMIYARLPFLEEILRFFPGLYSLWLKIWGAKVSLFVYWSPGVPIADRYHINIGNRAIIGGGCRIGAHLIALDKERKQRLTLAPVTIDSGAMVGLHAAVGPGCHVYADEIVPAGKLLKPFYSIKDGRIHRPATDS